MQMLDTNSFSLEIQPMFNVEVRVFSNALALCRPKNL